MSLIGSLQIANNALYAAQVGLQVTGNNIANANTPGYLRQEAIFSPSPPVRIGNLPIGMGVEVEGIIQKTDRFLADRLRDSASDLSGAEVQERAFLELEGLIGELSDNDLSTALTDFFDSINEVLNQPENLSVRNFAMRQGEALTRDVGRLDQRVQELVGNVNDQIESAADDVNRLLKQIAELNVKIVTMEGGGTVASDAVGLRDERELALTQLSELVGIRVTEQQTGSVSVFAGGDFLVFEGEYRTVGIDHSTGDDIDRSTIVLTATDAPLAASSGKLAGLYATRDEMLGGFLQKLDHFSGTLAFEFNKVYSSGQGLSGYDDLLSESAVVDADEALDQAGLDFTPVNGSFQLLVRNTQTDTVETTDIRVDLNGLDNDTSLNDLVAAIDSVDGVSATLTSDLKLRIASDPTRIEFAFADDTSGALAALGVNTFFTGSSASALGISNTIREDASKFAASRGGIGADVGNAVILADFSNRTLDSQDGESLAGIYEEMVADTTQSSSITRAVAEGFRVFHRTLEGEHLGISGVSIDDEAVKMISYQRAYQASARLIATLSELLNVLVNL